MCPPLLLLTVVSSSTFGPSPPAGGPNIVTKWQPPASAPLPAPMLVGNRTALFLHTPSIPAVSGATCAGWFAERNATFYKNLELSSMLSDVFPNCGHKFLDSGTVELPLGGDATTLNGMTARLHTMGVRVLPIMIATAAQVKALLASHAQMGALILALGNDVDANHYNGYVLDWNLDGFSPSDDNALALFLEALASHLLHSAGEIVLKLDSARPTANLADVIRASNSPLSVAITKATAVRDFDRFSNAQDAAVAQFGGANNHTNNTPLWTGFTLSTDVWTPRPTIVDTHTRMDQVGNAGVPNVVIDLDWAPNKKEVDFLDLYGYLVGAFRGGVGLPWETLSPPEDGAADTYAKWSDGIATWRAGQRLALGFGTGAKTSYDDPGLAWVRSNFISPQVMLHDRFLYDRISGNWTVQRWLDDISSRYGGVDSVLLWHSYPNIGVDDRSQFEMLRSLPGGIDSVRELVDDFHSHGVKVLLPYNPWDTGTKASADGATDVEELIKLIHAVDADGFNGDTMFGIPKTWYETSVANGGKPVAAQPECGVDERHETFENGSSTGQRSGVDLAWNPLSWNYWPYLPPGQYKCSGCSGGEIDAGTPMASNIAGVGPPLVSRARALESRHMAQICERWARNRTDGLHHAFINGGGYAPWESIWGVWNPLSEGDGQALQRTMHVLKYFNSQVIGGTFLPMIAAAVEPGVFVSQFSPSASGATATGTLWTIVNRRGAQGTPTASKATTRLPGDIATVQLPSNSSFAFYDVWHGERLNAAAVTNASNARARAGAGAGAGESTTFHISIAPRSFGAVAAIDAAEASSAAFKTFIADRKKFAQKPLATLSYDTLPLQQTMTDPGTTKPAQPNASNMSAVGSGKFAFEVHGVQVEGFGGLDGPDPIDQPDVQFSWETMPQRRHSHVVHTQGFSIDKYPVTNARYKAFLDKTGWAPSSGTQNFLKHWQSPAFTRPVPGTEEQPVRWVSLDDARAFCAAEGKRLPHSWEWQLTAQGFDVNSPAYPWGDIWNSNNVPSHVIDRDMGEPSNVGVHTAGAALSSGVEDLVGTIWQWSDEFCDLHTCRGIVRGGSWYSPQGSCWYFPAGWRLDEQNTMLLLSDSMDRSGGIGFRCLADAV